MASIGGYPAAIPNNYGPPPGQQRAHLYVGNLSPRVTEHMLQEIFSVAGPVLGVKIIPDRNFQHGGMNYGFVEYHEMRGAEAAIQSLNGRKIFDTEIKVNWAYQNQQAKEDLTNHCHVFVGDLSPEVTDAVLTKTFEAFGSLSDARVMWDMNTGKSRGYGFLAFRDRTDGEQAIATMNGEWLGSRAIRVNWANQKNQSSGGMGGGGPAYSGPPASQQGGGLPPPGQPAPPMGMMSPLGGQQQQPGFPPAGFQQPQQQPQAPPQPQYAQASGMSYDQVLSQSPATNTTIYVGNLVPYCQQQDLLPLFQSFGYVVEVRMQADRGFAFIKLDTHENSAMAIVNLTGTIIHGRPLKCSWGKDRAAGDTSAPVQPTSYAAQQQQAYAYPSYGAYPGYDQNAAATQPAQQWPTDPALAAQWAAYYAQYYPQGAPAQ